MRINLLIDLSGTLHIGDVACPGAVAALERIRRAKPVAPHSVHLRFCSNTTKESTDDLQARLHRAGFSTSLVPKTSILTSLEACKTLAVRNSWKPLLLLSSSAQTTFHNANDQLGGKAFYPRAEELPSQMNEEKRRQLHQCDTVIVALAPELFGAEWLDEAFRILSSEYTQGPKQLVACHRALYYRPSTCAPLSLGPGAYVTALEAACRRSSENTIVCGKPSRTFFETCLTSLRQDRRDDAEDDEEEERNIVIGDDIDADLGGGAIDLHLERVLVQTGKYRDGDEKRGTKPVQTYASFADFVDKELFVKSLLVDEGG